uniref:JmjC domain-containing protein n=1 Tax=Globisporangium ultimum (strain ATCC 200006 / CBS 805.95 / DAOM BR144) TaxID=431595 RepID=K3WY83_GLOUD
MTGKRIRAFVNPADAVLNDRVSTTIADSEVGDGSSSVRYARPRTRSGSVSTPDGRSLGSLRKRSLETGHAAASPATPSRSDKKIKSESTASTARPSKKQSGAKEIEILDDEEEEYAKHPIYTVPTHWEELYYKPVEIINIHSVGAKDRIQALRFAGTPFVLEGHMGWMKFSEGWVRPNGSLDTDAFLRGIHDVKVPVIERNYEETNPIKTHLPLSHYVKNYWEKGKAEYYMHQWQFPLNPKVAKSLCYKCEELPVIGDNLLLYWLDAVRGDNPLQYFFMGQKSTNSRMHQDPGGLDITIAPIVGTKRVSMLHRSAAKLDSVHETVNFHDVDLEKSPLLAFMPAWQVDIKPGQILFMPEGTFHACENMTACLSYHRFHVDSVNLPGFLASFLAQDSPSINHAEILWNAAHDLMSTLEVNYHASGQLDDQVATLRKLDALRALRHVARVLTLEDVVPTEDSWDWNKLLEDIDYLIGRIDVRAMQRAKKNSNHPALVSGGATTAAAAALAAKGDAGSGKSAAAAATAAALSAATHWEQLALRKGDTIGVQVFEKRNRAQILRIEHDMELVQVHYVDWGSIYDEFLPVSSLFHGGRAKKVRYKKAPNVHEQVWAVWGSSGQFYNAVVLKVVRTNACLVHYLKYENDWDQWILPGNIFKNYSLKERQANATA